MLNLGGSFTTADIGTLARAGGVVNLTGILTNTGGTLILDATMGSWNLMNGTVIGGTVAFADGSSFLTTTGNGTFDGVTLNGDMTISNGQSLTVVNGLTLNAILTLASTSTGFNTDLRFGGGIQTLAGTGEVLLAGSASNNRLVLGATGGGTTLTIGPGIEVHGRGSIIDNSTSSLVNEGVISADVPGQSLTVGITNFSFTNNGILEALVGATMNVNSSVTTLNGAPAESATHCPLR